MNKSLKKFTASAVAALSLMGTVAVAQTPIKIGYLGTFSGPLAPISNDMYDAFMLVVNRNGGKLGGVPVDIIKEDDQFKPDVGLQAVQKLIEKERVPMITGLVGSNVIMAVAKSITDKEVFLIGANAGPSPLAGAQCSPYQFITSWQNDSYAEAAGRFAQDKGYKKMVVITSNYQAGKDAARGFKKFYKGTIVNELSPAFNQPDYSAELSQIVADKPDAVFAFLPGAGVNFVRQFQQAGLMKSLPMVTVGMLDSTTLPALQDTALGAIGVHFWAPDTNTPANKQFVEAYEKAYNRIPSNFSAQGYDSALLLDAAIGKVKGNVGDKKAFMVALKEGLPNSVRGTLKFGNNNFAINSWYAYEVAKDAKGRTSLKTVATPLKDYQDSFHQLCQMK